MDKRIQGVQSLNYFTKWIHDKYFGQFTFKKIIALLIAQKIKKLLYYIYGKKGHYNLI